jgi:hypothetical protein
VSSSPSPEAGIAILVAALVDAASRVGIPAAIAFLVLWQLSGTLDRHGRDIQAVERGLLTVSNACYSRVTRPDVTFGS